MKDQDKAQLIRLIDSYGLITLLRYAAEYIGFGGSRYRKVIKLANELQAMNDRGEAS